MPHFPRFQLHGVDQVDVVPGWVDSPGGGCPTIEIRLEGPHSLPNVILYGEIKAGAIPITVHAHEPDGEL